MAELALLGSALAAGAAEAGAATAAAAGAAASAAPSLATIGTVTSLAGAGLGVAGSIQSGKAAKAAGEFNAAELERSANDARAEASKKAREQREQEARVSSRQRAVAASSGAGTTGGEGYLDLIGDTAARGEEQALSELYIGEQRARGREGQAAISRWQGDVSQKKSYLQAAGHAVDGLKAGIKGSNWLEDEGDLKYARKPGAWRTTTTLS